MTAFDTAWSLLKEAPRFAVHRGRVPIGEPIDPSISHDYSMLATHPHNEILGRPHGVFTHPIANNEDEEYRMPLDFLLNDLRNLRGRADAQGVGRENDRHFLIDMKPYEKETIAGNMQAADKLGFMFQNLQEANEEYKQEGSRDYGNAFDEAYFDELKDIVQSKYQSFNKPMADWMGDEQDALIGGDQIIDAGMNHLMFELTDPHFNTIPLEITDDLDMMHELITPRTIDPEDVLPMYGNSQKKIREWMADRVRG